MPPKNRPLRLKQIYRSVRLRIAQSSAPKESPTAIETPIGRLLATPGALALGAEGANLAHYLSRHQRGDWGDPCASDAAANDAALRYDDGRLFSAYETPHGRLWIITEADRSATTMLLPDEY